jgi:hypothetical protein
MRALHLELFTKPSFSDFLRVYQTYFILIILQPNRKGKGWAILLIALIFGGKVTAFSPLPKYRFQGSGQLYSA